MTEVNGRAVRPRGEPDDELVQRLRGLVADRMAQQAGRDGTMTAAARSRLGRALIREAMEEEAAAALNGGRAPLDQAAEQLVADRVYADLWGLGGFQPYLDDPDVESVNANGCDQVFVQYSGGYRSQVPPVAASDQELTDLIRAIAARGGIEERRFDRSSPRVSVPLPGGGRLFAVQAVTGRPCVAIRRDRPRRAGLRELVRNGTVDEPLAAFLAALVKARKNLLISGGTAVGKTTMLRALASAIPQGGAADHHRGLSRAVPGLGRRRPPRRRRDAVAGAQHRGRGRDHPGRAGAVGAADDPGPGPGRRGPRAPRSSRCSTP